MAENKNITFKTKDGKKLVARDEVQAAAFEKMGLEKLEPKGEQSQQQNS